MIFPRILYNFDFYEVWFFGTTQGFLTQCHVLEILKLCITRDMSKIIISRNFVCLYILCKYQIFGENIDISDFYEVWFFATTGGL